MHSPTLYRLCQGLLRHTWARIFRVSVSGLEHLPPGPAVLCPKHQRWEDIPVVGLALPPPLFYIAKVELFTTPGVREFLRALGGIPVDRASPRATLSSFRQLLPLLARRAYLVLFPEGTYVPGRVGPGKHRLIQYLLSLQERNGCGPLPFIPVGISYRPRTVGFEARVRLGPPLYAPRSGLAPALTTRLMAAIGELSRPSPTGDP
jgi:1-acyl-sn-glycerol-3-phosphate acyltransferase